MGWWRASQDPAGQLDSEIAALTESGSIVEVINADEAKGLLLGAWRCLIMAVGTLHVQAQS
jgi:hypothetical protein